MKKKLWGAMTLALLAFTAQAEEKQLTSPDGRLTVIVSDSKGLPTYQIQYDGKTFLQPSALGLVTDLGDYTQGMTLTKASDVKELHEHYVLTRIKKSMVEVNARRQTFSFAKDGKAIYDVEFHVGNNDVAFRYLLQKQGETRCCVIRQEATAFALPQGATSFLCPQMPAMGGWKRTAPSYETNYALDVPVGTKLSDTGYTFPCLFRNGNDGWLLISETGTDGDYCACRLLGKADGSYKIGFPQEGEMNGLGSAFAGVNLPGKTPWRTITLGSTLAPIAETTIPFDIVEEKYPASKTYEASKGSWSWIIRMDNSCNFEEQKEYIDFSAAMGWQTVLVDAHWSYQIGYDKVEELARYGKSKGVDLFLWYNSNGYWNDAPQGPHAKMHKAGVRRKEMAWMQKIGIRGIKVDFFGGDKQEMMQLYEDILTDANDFGIECIFHGCTLPRGWERMYPNYVASEAVLASENLHFSQQMCDMEASNATLHPIIRNTVGSMDFGGSALNKFYGTDNKHGSQRRTSDVFALATAVLFQSSVQHFALAPNNMTDAPAWAVDFMKTVPTTWDDIKFLDGYPGKYLIMARRHGDQWFVCGVNAQQEPLKVKLSLPMFAAGTALKVYADSKTLEGQVKRVKQSKKQTLDITIPCNGGLVVVNE